MTLVILLIVTAVLFGLAFITKRRFGVLGLGLIAGLVLSQQVTKQVASFLQYIDFPVQPLNHLSAASILLILAPALLMLFAGPRYAENRSTIIGSAAFATLGVVLLIVPLVTGMPLTDRSIQPFLSQVVANSSTIITASIVVAVFDLMNAHGKRAFGKKDKH